MRPCARRNPKARCPQFCKVLDHNVGMRSMTSLEGAASVALSDQAFARRGDEIFERDIRPHLGEDSDGQFIAIDVASGDYEVDADALEAMSRLRARHPASEAWLK